MPDTANYNPVFRRETWLFQKVGEVGGRPIYRRLGFNLVRYGDDSDSWIEPINEGFNSDPITPDTKTIDNAALDSGAIERIVFVEGRPYEVHGFNDPGADT